MYRGYVKIWRKSLDAGWLHNPNLWVFWCWCLMKASYKEIDVMVGLQQVHLMPGDFIFGRRAASEELKMSEQTIRTNQQTLSRMKNLTIKVTNKFSVISIVNWGIYQSEENESNHQSNQQLTSKPKKSTTNKNEKNKELLLPEAERISFSHQEKKFSGITTDHFSRWEPAYPAVNIDMELAKMEVWLLANPKNRKSNYERFISNWLTRAQDKAART